MSRLNLSLSLIILLGAIVLNTSCAYNKNIPYFKDLPDSLYLAAKNIPSQAFQDPTIQPNDILQISILTLDPQANNVLTAANSATYSVQPASNGLSANASSVTGFLVDKEGMVELPVTGKIKVSGLTTSVARDTIHNRVAEFYQKPVVNVRFANFNITVLGEVARPSTYVVPSEKVSILDAIGMAGDLTVFGKRENVMLIRDSLGNKQVIRFDLNNSSTLLSPYFYLRQGDVVYVEPNKSKIASTDAVRTRNLTLAASGISLLIVILTRL